MASIVDSSNQTASSHGTSLPKFSDYRSRVMLGDLPSDFLRIQLVEAQVYGPSLFDQPLEQDSNFLGYLNFSIVEAKLTKNSGPLGFLRMDPYARFRIGNVSHKTPTATGGGKNPQWDMFYRINLFRGMNRIHIELFDERSFTEDSFIGECDVEITQEVLSGQAQRQWYPLMGREPNANENQGEVLVIMSFMMMTPEQVPDMTDANLLNSSMDSSSSSSHSNSVSEPTATYSSDDIRTIEEMFPAIDRQIIIDLLEKNGGNKDLVVNHLLQNNAS